jgi:hypothetical protein
MNKFKSLRKVETELAYRKYQKTPKFPICYICTAPAIRTYQNWKVIQNEFSYDEVATKNDMIVPLRHTTEENLTEEELREFTKIKEDINDKYDMIIENTHKQKSIPGHFHLHLLQIKERDLEE